MKSCSWVSLLLMMIVVIVMVKENEAMTTQKGEAFVYYYRGLSVDAWKSWNWTQVSTVCLSDSVDSDDIELIKTAHLHGVRVSLLVTLDNPELPIGQWKNTTARKQWSLEVSELVKKYDLDGVNTDIEAGDYVKCGGWTSEEFVTLHKELRETLGMKSQITTAITIYADLVKDETGNNPRYDLISLSDYCDFIVFMCYDMQCKLGCTESYANSNLEWIANQTRIFIEDWKMQSSKIVIGLPWYAYDYECTWKTPVVGKECPLPDQMCACDGSFQIPFKSIPKHSQTIEYHDPKAEELYFNHKEEQTGKWKQTWFDNPKMLQSKIQLVKQKQMLGIAVWGAEKLEYNPPTKDTLDLWKQIGDIIVHSTF